MLFVRWISVYNCKGIEIIRHIMGQFAIVYMKGQYFPVMFKGKTDLILHVF